MRAGDLQHRIVLQRSTETRDALGSPVRAWSTLAEAWAALEWASGVEAVQGDREYPEVPGTLLIHRSTDTRSLREKDRVLLPGSETRLAEMIATTAQTSVVVEDAGVFPPANDFAARVGSEIVVVTSVSSNTLTCTRGAYSTTASTYLTGTALIHLLPCDIISVVRRPKEILELTVIRSEVRMTA